MIKLKGIKIIWKLSDQGTGCQDNMEMEWSMYRCQDNMVIEWSRYRVSRKYGNLVTKVQGVKIIR